MDRLVITTIIILKIVQDPLSLRFRNILKIILVSFWQPLDDRFTLASQLHTEEVKVQITRVTTISYSMDWDSRSERHFYLSSDVFYSHHCLTSALMCMGDLRKHKKRR